MRDTRDPSRDPVADEPPTRFPRQKPLPTTVGYGSPVQVVYGRRWIRPTVLMMRTPTPGQAWFRNAQTGAWEKQDCITANAILGLCEGPLLATTPIGNAMRDGSLMRGYPGDTLSAPAEDLLAGFVPGGYFTSTQPGYILNQGSPAAATHFYNGAQTAITFPDGGGYDSDEPVYYGTALLVGRFALKNGTWPDIRLLVAGHAWASNGSAAHGSAGSSPDAVLLDLWTNERYGLGLSSSLLDMDHGPDGDTDTSYKAWVTARNSQIFTVPGWGLKTGRWMVARVIEGAESAMDAIKTLLYETHAGMFAGPDGKMHVYALDPTSSMQPFALNENDYLPPGKDSAPVEAVRVAQSSVYNVWPVELDAGAVEVAATADGKAVSLPYEDASLAESRAEAIRRADVYQSRWIQYPEHATQLSFLLAQRSVSIRNLFRVNLGERRILLTPGDILQASETAFPITNKNLMVISAEQGSDGKITVAAEEWLDMVAAPVPSPVPPEGTGDPGGGEPGVDPQPTTPVDLTAVYARLNAIVADNRIVNSEKSYLSNVLQTLFGARSTLLATAASFSSPVDATDYDEAMDDLLAYARAAIPADDAEAVAPPTSGWHGLGLPGTSDPPTETDYANWQTVGGTDGKINIHPATLRSRLNTAAAAQAILQVNISDRLRGDVAGIQAFVGHVGTDGWLTSNEKASIWFLYSELRNQHSALAAQAGQVSAANLAAYTSAWNALKLYARTAQPGEGVTPTSAHGLNMGKDTAGNGTLTDYPSEAQVSAWIAYDTALHPETFRSRFNTVIDLAHQVTVEIAQDAWQRLSNAASDGVLTRGEKPSVFREYQNLVSERAQIDLQADATTALVSGTLAQAVDTEHQAYKLALWNLQNYMNDSLGCPPDAGTGSPSYVTTVPSSANLTTWLAAGSANGVAGDSVVVASTMLGNFAAVITAKATLLRRISEESTNLASTGYAATVTLGSSKAEADMSNVTGAAINQALVDDAVLFSAAQMSNEIRGDGSIPATAFRANAIGAQAIASDSILARHILVSDFGGAALNANPSCSDLSAWGAPPSFGALTNVSVQSVSDGKAGRTVLRSAAGVAVAAMSDRVPVDPAKRYRVRAQARASGASVAGFRLALMVFDGSDAAIVAPDGFGTGNYWFTPGGALTLSTAWTAIQGFAGGSGFVRASGEGGAIPATARTMAVAVLFNQGSAGGAYHEVQDLRIEEQVSADLMVDGTITGNKVAAGAIASQHIAVMPVVAFTTDAAGHLPYIDTSGIVSLPSSNRNAGEPRALMDMTRQIPAGPNPKVFQARFRGATSARGFVFNVLDWVSVSQTAIAVLHNGISIQVVGNNAFDTSWGVPASKSAGVSTPSLDEVLTVHWYNSPVESQDGDTYRCRVYIDGKLAASFTTVELGGINLNVDVASGYAGVLLGNPGSYDTTLRVSDCLLGQAGVIIGDGAIEAQHIKASTIDASRLTFTPVTGGDVIARINASSEGLDITADRISINAATTFGSGYDPSTKETPAGAQAKATAAYDSIRSQYGHVSDRTLIDGARVFTGTIEAEHLSIRVNNRWRNPPSLPVTISGNDSREQASAVLAGHEYLFSAWFQNTHEGSSGMAGPEEYFAGMTVMWLNSSGGVISQVDLAVEQNLRLKYQMKVVAPTFAVSARFILRVIGSGEYGTSELTFDSPEILDALDGSLVVDGSITASKLQADALQTSNYQGSGSGDTEYAVYGAKMRKNASGAVPSLLVDPAGLRIGTKTVRESSFFNQWMGAFEWYRDANGSSSGFPWRHPNVTSNVVVEQVPGGIWVASFQYTNVPASQFSTVSTVSISGSRVNVNKALIPVIYLNSGTGCAVAWVNSAGSYVDWRSSVVSINVTALGFNLGLTGVPQ